jgi:membrane-associated phospholipid phosphatase
MKIFDQYLAAPEKRKSQFVVSLVTSLLLFFWFLLITYSVTSHGFLDHLDLRILHWKRHTFRGLSSHILLAIDDLGLRGFTATVLIIVAILIGWKYKTIRPFNLSVLALLALNGVVGIAKLSIGRTKPRLHIDLLNTSGMSYPSGHAANALISWGLIAYLLSTYFIFPLFSRKILYPIVGLMTLSVCVVSLARNTHWFSDLFGGLVLGGSILVAVIAIDRFFPSTKQVK